MSFVTRGRGKAFVQAVLSQDAATIAAQDAEIARRVRQEVSRLREKAEADGRAQGEQAGRAALAPDAAAMQSAATALNDAWAQLAAPLAGKEHDLAQLVTELSFLLARHITGVEAATNPASLQSLVTRLIAEAATERGPRQTLLLRLNPADHAQIAAVIPTETANLLADESIAQGGARIEIIAPEGDPIDKIEWDATLTGRFEAIRTALGLSPTEPPAP
jgi:flagellar biosynthesis/type III secretory pathway protein FliH